MISGNTFIYIIHRHFFFFFKVDDDNSCSGDVAIKEEEILSEEDDDDDVPLSEIVTSRKYVKRLKRERKSKSERRLGVGGRGRAPKVSSTIRFPSGVF